MVQQAFDKVGDQFVSYYGTVRGHVREQLTRQNLSPYLGDGTMEVLDIGGGDGRDAIWLAKMGHRVNLIDPSSSMLAKAREAIDKAGVSELIRLEQGDPEQILAGRYAFFDLVLSHGVFMYTSDPQTHLNLLEQVVKPRGVASVLTKGIQGSLFRLVHNGKISETVNLRQTGHLTNNLGENVLAIDEKALAPMLQAARLTINQTFGVRIASEFDYRAISSVDKQELSAILEIEAELGKGERTKGMGQMLHFICKPQGGGIDD